MHIGWTILLAAAAGWMISGALSIPWIWGIGIAALAALFLQSGGAGTGAVVGSVVGGVTHGVGSVVGFIRRLAVWTIVFVALALLVTKITGISLDFVSSGFKVLGLTIWGWPSNARWEFLLGVSSLMVVAGIAARAADGDWKMTMKIFGVASVVIWLMLNLGTVAPATKAALPSGTALDRGTARIVRLVVAVPSFVLDTPTKVQAWWNKPPAPASTASPSAPAPAPSTPTAPIVVGQAKQLYRFADQPSGCVEQTLPANWSSYPKGGGVAIVDLSTGKTILVDRPGVDNNVSPPPGRFGFCPADPGAWGVEIWK